MIKYVQSLDNISSEQLQGFFVGWREPLTCDQHFEILKNSQFIVLALDKSKIVGFVNCLSDKVNFAFIPMLEVVPQYQNRGIGTKLMNMMIDQLQDIKCIDLTCDIHMQNFYKRFGMLKSHGMVFRNFNR